MLRITLLVTLVLLVACTQLPTSPSSGPVAVTVIVDTATAGPATPTPIPPTLRPTQAPGVEMTRPTSTPMRATATPIPLTPIATVIALFREDLAIYDQAIKLDADLHLYSEAFSTFDVAFYRNRATASFYEFQAIVENGGTPEAAKGRAMLPGLADAINQRQMANLARYMNNLANLATEANDATNFKTDISQAAAAGLPKNDPGCGSRGGPGYRLLSGKCASWADYAAGRH